ncbi:MAG: DUF445 family protein [Clostridiales bacterium]|jgi:uncharacterized membrane protein YheB (UPF0754 family)|nr:DUF445 family protein [Clostridiales bacterium]
MERLLLLAVVGALIGWSTNVVAIKLMFRPLEPIRIPGTRFSIQGLIPKRKTEIAKSIGDVISEELLSIEQIMDKFLMDMDKKQIIEQIKEKVNQIANEKMPAVIPSMFKGIIIQNIDKMIDESGDELVVEMGEKLTHKAIESIDISKMIEDKINGYNFEKIEEMTLRIAKKELKHIEWLGGVIGFFIGLIQGVIILYLFQ